MDPSLYRFCGFDQNRFPPGGIVVPFSIQQEMSSVVSAIRVGMDDFQAIDVANLRQMPHWIAFAKRWSHLHASFQNEVAGAPSPRIQFDGVIHRSVRNRFFDVCFAGSAVPPLGAILGLSRINDKAKGVISLSEGL